MMKQFAKRFPIITFIFIPFVWLLFLLVSTTIFGFWSAGGLTALVFQAIYFLSAISIGVMYIMFGKNIREIIITKHPKTNKNGSTS